MINTEIIYRAAGSPAIETIPHDGHCKICGKSITAGIKEKDALSGNFTNWSECKRIDSNFVCEECAWCLKNAELRTNSFIADNSNLYLLKKNDLEEYLFNLDKYVHGEFVVGITFSFKKHNSFRCRVNSNPRRFYIRQEDNEYLFDVDKLKPLYDKLNDAYLQFNKEELSTGQYGMIGIEQFGLNKFREYEGLFKQHRGTAQFELLVYMMNSERRQEYMQAKIEAQKTEKARLKEIEKKNKKGESKICQKSQGIQQQEKTSGMQLSLL